MDQLIQPLYVMQMDEALAPDARLDNEGSRYGFRMALALPGGKTAPATICRMKRP